MIIVIHFFFLFFFPYLSVWTVLMAPTELGRSVPIPVTIRVLPKGHHSPPAHGAGLGDPQGPPKSLTYLLAEHKPSASGRACPPCSGGTRLREEKGTKVVGTVAK